MKKLLQKSKFSQKKKLHIKIVEQESILIKKFKYPYNLIATIFLKNTHKLATKFKFYLF